MTPLKPGGLTVVAILLSSIGCTETNDKPSYAELVVIYNAELAALDRLEENKKELIADYEEEHRPTAPNTLKSISELVESTGSSSPEEVAVPADPNEALDQAVRNAEKTHAIASKLLQSFGEGGTPQIEYSEEFKQQLAEIDAEIEAQKSRVERARSDRDAAEAGRSP